MTEESMTLSEYAQGIAEMEGRLSGDLTTTSARACVLLIAAAKTIQQMAWITRHSIADSTYQASALDRAARDAAKASKQAGALAQGALNWARAVDPQLALAVQEFTQDAVDAAGWNPRIKPATGGQPS